MVLSRLLLVPVIAAIGYEILRFGARHRANPLVKAIMAPGILVQMITTKRPSDDQIEVAIVSMEQALEADGEDDPGRVGAARARAPRHRSGRRSRLMRRAIATRDAARDPAATHRPR